MEKIYAQITNGTIDPNWVMIVVVGVASYLLNRTLSRIEKVLENHESRIVKTETDVAVLKAKDE